MIPTRPALRLIISFWVIAAVTPAGAVDQAASSAPAYPLHYFERMTKFLSDAPQFQTTVWLGYDVVQASGQKIEFNERHRITIARPDRLRADIRKSNGETGAVIFDGRKITAYSSTHKVYAETEKQGDIDAVLVYFLRDLKMRLPLALMFRSDFSAEMDKRLVNLDFVEISQVTDTPYVHLAGRTEQVDFQVWIPRSGKPLPRRLTITYRDAEGQPKFWANFEDWNMAPDVASAAFDFKAPADSERIPFLVEMDRVLPRDDRQGED